MKNGETRRVDVLFIVATLLIVIAFVIAARSQTKEELDGSGNIIATGGTFTMEKAVTAGGGNKTQGGVIELSGTSGQSIAGVRSNGENYSLYSGFWTADDLVPTAAPASVSGRVLTSSGGGIKNVTVTLTDAAGTIRCTKTSTFGYFQFTEVEIGQTYLLSVYSKKYTFAQPTRPLSVVSDLADINFVAIAQ